MSGNLHMRYHFLNLLQDGELISATVVGAELILGYSEIRLRPWIFWK